MALLTRNGIFKFICNSLKNKLFLQSFLILTLFTSIAAVNTIDSKWGYSGINGPSTWEGKCGTGKHQSPIDIDTSKLILANFKKLNFQNYDRIGPVNIVANDDTVVVNGMHLWEGRKPYISGGGLTGSYELHQFHIHWSQFDTNGSEHSINGIFHPVEIHMVHIKRGLNFSQAVLRSDGLAAISLMANLAEGPSVLAPLEGALNEMLGISNNTVTLGAFQPILLLPPQKESFYRYKGSLTTPLCEEAVTWSILTNPVTITSSQLQLLRMIRDKHHKSGEVYIDHNRRPIQPLNDRRIYLRTEIPPNEKSSEWKSSEND